MCSATVRVVCGMHHCTTLQFSMLFLLASAIQIRWNHMADKTMPLNSITYGALRASKRLGVQTSFAVEILEINYNAMPL
jgi:hypothetical protein